jgi:hypothetical protein
MKQDKLDLVTGRDIADPDRVGKLQKVLRHFPQDMAAERRHEILREAFEAYVLGAEGPVQLAAKFPDMEKNSLFRIVRIMGWDRQREEHLLQMQTAVALRYTQVVEKLRGGIVDAVAGEKVGTLLSSLVEQMSDAASGSEDEKGTRYVGATLRRLAEAYKQVADVALSAVAAGEKAMQMPEAAHLLREKGDGKAGKQPWLAVNASGPVTLVSGDGARDDVRDVEASEEGEG